MSNDALQKKKEQVENLIAFAEDKGKSESEIEQQFSMLKIHFFDDDEVDLEKPYHDGSRYNLYFLDATSHCLTLTNELGPASAVVLGRK